MTSREPTVDDLPECRFCGKPLTDVATSFAELCECTRARPGAVIVHGDALVTIQSMESATVDAVVMDPPYCSGSVGEAQRSAAKGQGLRSENIRRLGWFTGDNMGTAGLVYLMREIAFESARVCKPTASLLVFCDWRMVPNVVPAIESAGLRYQNLIVWDKGHFGLGQGFRAQHEFAAHFTYGSPEYHHQGTGNVLSAKRITAAERQHQTQKPADLLRQMLRVVVPPGGLVLDPFAGSGSTGVAAVEEGMRFIGIERDEEHVATARQRIADAAAQTSLFMDGAA